MSGTVSSTCAGALELEAIMDATPSDLKEWPTNIYSQIAIALKGGELREVGWANLAERLVHRGSSGATLRTAYSNAAVRRDGWRHLLAQASSEQRRRCRL